MFCFVPCTIIKIMYYKIAVEVGYILLWMLSQYNNDKQWILRILMVCKMWKHYHV